MAHSHGGNVVKVASRLISHTIDNLVNLGTPQNFDLPAINRLAVKNYCNVSSFFDPVQFLGSSPEQIGNTAKFLDLFSSYFAQAFQELIFGDPGVAADDFAVSSEYLGLSLSWFFSTKIEPLGTNVFLVSPSHSDLHTVSVWDSIQGSCGLR